MATGDWGVVGAAVDPAGRVALLTRSAACDDQLERWNLAGARQWRRSVGSCGAGIGVGSAITADPRAHHVRVGGAFTGTVDFGSGPFTSRGGAEGVVIDVLP